MRILLIFVSFLSLVLSGCAVRVGQYYGDEGWDLVGSNAPLGTSCHQLQTRPKLGEEPELVKWAKGAQGANQRSYEYRRVDVYRAGRWERCHFEWRAGSQAGSRSSWGYRSPDYHYSPGRWSRW